MKKNPQSNPEPKKPESIKKGASGAGNDDYLLTAYLFGDLNVAGKEEVERRLSRSPDQRAEFEQLQATKTLLEEALLGDDETFGESSGDDDDAAKPSVIDPQQIKTMLAERALARRRSWMRRATGIAAVALLGVTLFSVVVVRLVRQESFEDASVSWGSYDQSDLASKADFARDERVAGASRGLALSPKNADPRVTALGEARELARRSIDAVQNGAFDDDTDAIVGGTLSLGAKGAAPVASTPSTTTESDPTVLADNGVRLESSFGLSQIDHENFDRVIDVNADGDVEVAASEEFYAKNKEEAQKSRGNRAGQTRASELNVVNGRLVPPESTPAPSSPAGPPSDDPPVVEYEYEDAEEDIAFESESEAPPELSAQIRGRKAPAEESVRSYADPARQLADVTEEAPDTSVQLKDEATLGKSSRRAKKRRNLPQSRDKWAYKPDDSVTAGAEGFDQFNGVAVLEKRLESNERADRRHRKHDAEKDAPEKPVGEQSVDIPFFKNEANVDQNGNATVTVPEERKKQQEALEKAREAIYAEKLGEVGKGLAEATDPAANPAARFAGSSERDGRETKTRNRPGVTGTWLTEDGKYPTVDAERSDLGFVQQGSPTRDATIVNGQDRWGGRVREIVDDFRGHAGEDTGGGGGGGARPPVDGYSITLPPAHEPGQRRAQQARAVQRQVAPVENDLRAWRHYQALDGALTFESAQAQSLRVPPPAVGDEGLGRDGFRTKYKVNPFVDTRFDHQSTFSMDVDTASFTRARDLLNQQRLPNPKHVRVEEFVNSFPETCAPDPQAAFSVFTEGGPSPFGTGLELVKITVKARELRPQERKATVLTFVVDASGSMHTAGRFTMMRSALNSLVEALDPEDRVAIIAYRARAYVVLPHTPAREKARIRGALASLHAGGGTNVESGLDLGYRLADEVREPKALNRVILCSDGVANIGSRDPEAILKKVKVYAQRGIYLSVVGFGGTHSKDYKDSFLEKVSGEGNGNYTYVANAHEAATIFQQHLPAILHVLAEDAKLQADFNPKVVSHYRLLGYENRDIADKDFRNDKVDAAEVGPGTVVTVLYEIERHPNAHGDLGRLFVRYRDAGTRRIEELDFPLPPGVLKTELAQTTSRFRFIACVAEIAELLRASYWARDGSFGDVLDTLYKLDTQYQMRTEWRQTMIMAAQAQQLTLRQLTEN